MSNFFIPKKINVGFQNRQGTYTGRLAYIIYFDEKGKLRKETSWNGWRDKKIDNIIHDNEPTSGFVLNKKVGDYVSDWNHRQAYVRVYDPRDFEFEITVQNLLYILENATSTKGKGLEGDFVYGWDGKDLVLIPCDAPDYQELVKLNELRHSDKKIGAKELKIGATYRTRQNGELIYMGKFHEYDYKYVYEHGKRSQYIAEKSKKPKFWFAYESEDYKGNRYYAFTILTSVTQKLVEEIDGECVNNYAEIFDKLECKHSYSPIDHSKDTLVPMTVEELEKKYSGYRYSDVLNQDGHKVSLRRKENGTYYYEYDNPDFKPQYGYFRNDTRTELQKTRYLRHEFKDAQDVIEKIKPHRLRVFLENGKVYSEGL